MDLNGLIGFNVIFDFSTVPTLVLQPTTTIPDADKPNLSGHFIITQPDGLTTIGDFNSVRWDSFLSQYTYFSKLLRLSSDGSYQKGVYSIVFFAQCTGYLYSQFTRSWDMEYNPITQKLESAFDCFTPSLQYKDNSIYSLSGYTIPAQNSIWTSKCNAGASTIYTQNFDLAINGNYYDCAYTITNTKVLKYQHSSYLWLTINQKFYTNISISATIPPSMKDMFGYLVDLETARDLSKTNCIKYDHLDKAFNEASTLFQTIKLKISEGSIIGLINLFNQFYNITHNYAPFIYINTNLIIPTYQIITPVVDNGNSYSGIAGQDLGGGKLVYLSAGSFFLYDANIETLADMAFGITQGAAHLGGLVNVQMGGVFSEVGLGLIAGKIYYSASNGLLSTTPGKVCTIIGIAVDANNLKMEIQQSIITA